MNDQSDADRSYYALLALLRSTVNEPLVVGRLDRTVNAGTLLAIGCDADRRPVLREANDNELAIEPRSDEFAIEPRSDEFDIEPRPNPDKKAIYVFTTAATCPACGSSDVTATRGAANVGGGVLERPTKCVTCGQSFRNVIEPSRDYA